MKASELRIGNYFKPDSFDRKENEFSIICAKDLLELELDPQDDFYSPISLTEEWILKLGFKKRITVVYEWKTTDYIKKITHSILGERLFYLYIGYGKDGRKISVHYLKSIITYVKYVHELQNLYFSLTGEELELKEVENP